MNDFFKHCRNLCEVIAPSGFEKSVKQYIVDHITNHQASIMSDSLGNLIVSFLTGHEDAKKIAITAHMDSAGFVLLGDSKDGAYVGSLSSWKPENVIGQNLIFLSGERFTVLKALNEGKQFLLDRKIGDESLIGGWGTFVPSYSDDGNNLSGTFLDDRVGCACLLSIINMIKSSAVDLYFIFTVQEEIGNKGARALANQINFDEVLVVDTTIAKDKKNEINVELGGGAAYKICDGSGICSPDLVATLTKIASNNDIKCQKEILTYAGSDFGAFLEANSFCKTGAISIPCKSMHSTKETMRVKDINAVFNLIKSFVNDYCKVQFL